MYSFSTQADVALEKAWADVYSEGVSGSASTRTIANDTPADSVTPHASIVGPTTHSMEGRDREIGWGSTSHTHWAFFDPNGPRLPIPDSLTGSVAGDDYAEEDHYQESDEPPRPVPSQLTLFQRLQRLENEFQNSDSRVQEVADDETSSTHKKRLHGTERRRTSRQRDATTKSGQLSTRVLKKRTHDNKKGSSRKSGAK